MGTSPMNEPILLPVNRVPIADLDSEREPGQGRDPAQAASRRTSGVNSLSAAIASIWVSSRSRRAVTISTVS